MPKIRFLEKYFTCRKYTTIHGLLPNEDIGYSNVSKTVRDRMGRNLIHVPNHPLAILRDQLLKFFSLIPPNPGDVVLKKEDLKIVDSVTGKLYPTTSAGIFAVYDKTTPLTSTEDSFDNLLVPTNHISREKANTYYVNKSTVLRPHMTAHTPALLRGQVMAALSVGDVFRRDEIDRSHYPVFHQMDSYRVFSPSQIRSSNAVKEVEDNMKETLEGMAKFLFGNVETRWVNEYFPFTNPSHELEIKFKGEWLEVLGCGILQNKIMTDAKLGHCTSWAFGLGLERLAMVLFNIPDIRLFWSTDERFLSQFKNGIAEFQPFSKYPKVERDIAFWISDHYDNNAFFELVRTHAGDLVEGVESVDTFTHPKTGKTSMCYRIIYRSMERSLTNEEVNQIQDQIRTGVQQMNCELR